MYLSGKRASDFVTAKKGFPLDISPASIDLRIDSSETMLSGDSILVSSMEHVKLPENVVGWLTLRTSSFRKGLSLASLGLVDPGYYGTLTFRLTNVTKEPITLMRGDRIAQIAFSLVLASGDLYDGKYQGSDGVARYIPDKEQQEA